MTTAGDETAAAGPGFPSRWSAEILRSAPLIAPARQFLYPQNVPGEEDALARGALQLMVRPQVGGAFLATCARGFASTALPTGVWGCPNPEQICALAGGYAYLIDTLRPETCSLLPLRPVVAVLPALGQQLLLFAGFHTIVAWGTAGLAWETARLSWEGVRLGEVRDGRLSGWGWEMRSDRELPFTVDLRTGEHEGGGYLRP